MTFRSQDEIVCAVMSSLSLLMGRNRHARSPPHFRPTDVHPQHPDRVLELSERGGVCLSQRTETYGLHADGGPHVLIDGVRVGQQGKGAIGSLLKQSLRTERAWISLMRATDARATKKHVLYVSSACGVSGRGLNLSKESPASPHGRFHRGSTERILADLLQVRYPVREVLVCPRVGAPKLAEGVRIIER